MKNTKPLFINGQWQDGHGKSFVSQDSVTHEVLWEAHSANQDDVNQAVSAAKQALESWSELSWEERETYLRKFQKLLEDNKDSLSKVISKEVGKPLWESKTEVAAMINKVNISIQAFQDRTRNQESESGGQVSAIRYKPHGIVAVFGPYNFPGHLANGHIVPALLAGNTIVFKQSELTPLTGQKTIELWEKAGLPKGVLNLVQGAKETGQALATHPDINGLFFTGSSKTGTLLSAELAKDPSKILALEMGGNNPLIVTDVENLKAAAYLTVQSAYITSGQRCTCARRLILIDNEESQKFLDELTSLTQSIRVGHHTESPEPFMGPVISTSTADQILKEQEELLQKGAKPLLKMKRLKDGTALLSPGLLDVTNIKREDKEIFGPFLQVIRVSSFADAIKEANNTRYGLSAGLISDNKGLYEEFFKKIRAGIVNWNRQITGASSNAPFGGIGLSGNHRPSAYFAADYCAYPVASIEAEKVVMPQNVTPGLESR